MGTLLNRRRYMGGSSAPLPYDAEVEYLRNTGLTQHIDTGIVANEGLRIVTRVTPRQSISDRIAIGAYNNNGRFYVIYQYPKDKWGGGYGNYFSGTVTMAMNTTVELDVEYTSSAQVIKIDGTTIATFTKPSSIGTPTSHLFLFKYTATSGSFLIDIGETKIWMNNVLVRHYIPVIVGTTGYMYDKVSRSLFSNGGTGEFTLGAPLSYNNKIEYLESSGTEYINTGITNYAVGTKVEVTFSQSATSTEGGIIGISEAGGFELYTLGTTLGFYNKSGVSVSTTISTDTQYVVIAELTNSSISMEVNGTTYQKDATPQDKSSTFYLFRHTTNYYFKGRIYGAKIWQNSILVRDFIPVRAGGMGCMYDKVSNKLFINAGTGSFTLGPDKT